MKTLLHTLSMAARNLGRHRRRTLSTLLAITIGLIGLTFLDGYITYSMNGLKEVIIKSGTGHIQVAVSPAYFDEGDQDPFPYLIHGSSALAKTLRQRPEVKAVIPVMAFQGVMGASSKTETVSVTAMPADLAAENLSMRTFTEGQDLDPAAGGQLVVGRGLARKLNLKPGSTVTLYALGASGGVNNQSFTVAGIISTGLTALDNVTVFADLKDAQALNGAQEVPQLTIFLENTGDTEAVVHQLRSETFSQKLVFKTWDQLSPFYQMANGSYQMVLGVARLIILLVALFSISGTLTLSVMERLREVGTLRAFGTRRRLVVFLFLTEGLLLGLAGALVGSAAGMILTQSVNLLGGISMPPQPGTSDSLTILFTPLWANFTANGLWVLAAACVGALFPAVLAARQNPAVLLRTA